MIKPKILAKNENYKVSLYDNKAKITFIVFHDIKGDIDTRPFGLNFLLKSKYNIISCNNKKKTKYQYLSFDEFKHIVTPYIKGKDIFLYGSSLGGYCAIYYAGAVNGTVIASSPRNSFHPMFSKSDKKVKFLHKKHLYKNNLTKKVFIFYMILKLVKIGNT